MRIPDRACLALAERSVADPALSNLYVQPREALLKYADAAETNPIWAGSWANQPKVFRNIEDEPDEDPRLKNAPKPKGLDRK